jgi:hypothetical protein
MFITRPLSQRDPRWSSQQLGFGAVDSTIGNYGCVVTSLTMLVNGHGFNETPGSLNDRLKSLGPNVGYTGETRNLMVWDALRLALPGMRFADRVDCMNVPAPMDKINATLNANKAVVVQLDMAPQQGFFSQHWVLLYARDGDEYLIHDPWLLPSESRTPITRDYSFAGGVEKIITHCIFYEGPIQNPTTPVPAPPSPPPVTPLPFALIVNSDPDIVALGGIALRDQPSLAGNIIKRLPAGTELGVHEDLAHAQAKLGIPGEWINVATNGRTGFVAAWLVHSKSVGIATTRAAPRDLVKDTQPGWQRVTLVVNRPRKASGAKNPPSPTLRSKPSVGKVLVELKPNTPLVIVESQSSALKKVGVRGKWIKVRDAAGNTGYVAAVYVHVRTQPKDSKRKSYAKKITTKG